MAAHRQDRPWMGQTVARGRGACPPSSPDCYLCPGNRAISGAVNPPLPGVFVFDNDHPCVGPDAPRELRRRRRRTARSRRRASRACLLHPAPRPHARRAPVSRVTAIVDTWREQTRDLGARPEVKQVLIFENKGEVVGVSNPHPHGQIYATNFAWKTFDAELEAQRRHARETGPRAVRGHHRRRAARRPAHPLRGRARRSRSCRTSRATRTRSTSRRRAACRTCIADRRARPSRLRRGAEGRRGALRQPLAACRSRTCMPLHQAPTDGGDYRGFHFHIEFHPPLRRRTC